MNEIVHKDFEFETSHYMAQPYARVILPEEDGSFRGEIIEFPGCIATGETAGATLEKLEEVARDWILAALEQGQNIPQPIESSNDFSGRLVLRLPKSIHKKAALVAEREGVSLNQFIMSSLSIALGEKAAGGVANVNFHSYTQNNNNVNLVHVASGSRAWLERSSFSTTHWTK